VNIFGFELSLRRKEAGPTPVRGALYGYVREPYAGAWQQGVALEPMGGILSFSAAYACVTRIAQDIAKLEINVTVENDDEVYVNAPDSSPFWRPILRPNHYQNRMQWMSYWMTGKLLYGNAYGLKQRDARGMVSAIYMLDPRRVTPMITSEGDVYYSLSGDDLSKIQAGAVVPASEIIHDRGPTLWHPLIGISPLYACALSATQGLKIQRNSETFFRNMSRPSGLLTAPGTIDDPTAIRLKQEWEANFSGGNIGRLAVLGDGLTYEPMTIPPETAQLIEQLKWTVEDVARAFGMPLYKIGAGPVPTSNNVQALQQQYYSDCLQVHIESAELCLDDGLSVPPDYCVQFDLGGLMRMDSATQVEMLSKAVGGGLMSPDEGRARLNLGPVAGGAAVYLQQQNFSTEALAKRDAQADPFGTAKAPTPAAPAAEAPPAAAERALLELLTRTGAALDSQAATLLALEQRVAAIPLALSAPAEPTVVDDFDEDAFMHALEAKLAEAVCG
jgi:HK97 family phage portal protein